jgi:hypothetical protein
VKIFASDIMPGFVEMPIETVAFALTIVCSLGFYISTTGKLTLYTDPRDSVFLEDWSSRAKRTKARSIGIFPILSEPCGLDSAMEGETDAY